MRWAIEFPALIQNENSTMFIVADWYFIKERGCGIQDEIGLCVRKWHPVIFIGRAMDKEVDFIFHCAWDNGSPSLEQEISMLWLNIKIYGEHKLRPDTLLFMDRDIT